MAIKQKEWLTYAEVTGEFNRSERTIRRYAEAGRIREKKEARDGKIISLFSAADLARLQHEEENGTGREAPDAPTEGVADTGGRLLVRSQANGGTLQSMATHLLSAAMEMGRAQSERPLGEIETPWIDIPTASKISGLPESDIRKLVRQGVFRRSRRIHPRLLRREVLAYEGAPVSET